MDGTKVDVTSMLKHKQDVAIVNDDTASDDKTLGALGYKQEFKRDLTILESFSVSFSVLGLLPSIASTLSYSLGYSGRAGTVWGWLVAGIMIQSTAFSMAELCSSMPTAGGLYYAAAALAPPGWGPLASWWVGWSNFCGFVTAPCSLNYTMGMYILIEHEQTQVDRRPAYMITTAAAISYPDYTPEDWHIYLIFLLILVIQGLIAIQSTKIIGHANVIGTVWNVIMVIIFIIWVPVGAINHPKTNTTSEVWTDFQNGTSWPIGWATIMGFLTTIWTMSGYDAPFHLTEECSNSAIASPRAIVMTAQLGLYLGWAIILVLVYTVKDVNDVVSGQYGQPFGSYCLQVLGERSGLTLFSLTMIGQFFCGLGCTITASRVIFAYSRDGAIPLSKIWSRVSRRSRTPVLATWGVLFVSALLGLLVFAGPVAIGAVFSIGAIGQYTSFTTPIALKLLFGRNRFRPGPWNLGKASNAVNALACGWWLLILPALCFPAASAPTLTLQTMNWTCLIYGGAMFLAMSYYAIDARKWFKGPRINVEHLEDRSNTDIRRPVSAKYA